MTYLEQVKQYAEKEGRIWLGGEMEFPANCYIGEAYAQAVQVAEACGYLVSKRGMATLSIVGGDIPGEIVLDWFHSDEPGPTKIELWTAQSIYLEPKKTGVTK